MAMQTDVLSVHLNQSGLMVTTRARLKGYSAVGTATAGTINIWDSVTAPTAATYERAGFVITVTSNAHGLIAGRNIGLTFTAGGATNGNYTIQTASTNTFTVTDINSGTVAAGAACNYNTRLLMSLDTNAQSDFIAMPLPGQGILAENGIYAQMTNQTGLTIYYG